mgnify:CR=1 FL=1
MNKNYSGYGNAMFKMKLLGIKEVTTPRQKKNGTREFLLPVKDQYGGKIHVASFASGYVRRTKAGGYCPSWQINKRCESEPQYYGPFENGYYRKYTTWTCKLIPNEVDRLEYLVSYCLKNYYIGQANKLSSGEFIPKWKHEYELSQVETIEPEVKVIINGHRYNITPWN